MKFKFFLLEDAAHLFFDCDLSTASLFLSSSLRSNYLDREVSKISHELTLQCSYSCKIKETPHEELGVGCENSDKRIALCHRPSKGKSFKHASPVVGDSCKGLLLPESYCYNPCGTSVDEVLHQHAHLLEPVAPEDDAGEGTQKGAAIDFQIVFVHLHFTPRVGSVRGWYHLLIY